MQVERERGIFKARFRGPMNIGARNGKEIVMLEEIKKGLFAGIGAVLLTRDKVERVVERLVNERKLSREEGQRLVDELVQTGEKQWSSLEDRVMETIRNGIDHLDIGRRTELEALRERVENVEKRITLMEEPSPTDGME